MTAHKRFLSLVIAVILTVSCFPSMTYSAGEVYSGVPSGSALIKNASFTDIAGNPNAEDIMKMSVYSLIREYGSSRYNPGQAAARQDVLAALVRAIGRQEDAVKEGERLIAQDTSLTPVNAYMKGHIEIARSSGIINNNEIASLSELSAAEKAAAQKEVDALKKSNWKMTKVEYDRLLAQKQDQRSFNKSYGVAATREEAALWTARALKLTPAKGEEIRAVYNFSDWKSIKTENIPYIEAALNKGLIKGSSTSTFAPKSAVTRGELASVISAVANESLDTLGYTTGYGKVIDVRTARDVGLAGDMKVTDITIQTPSASTVNISVQRKINTGSDNYEAVPVVKGGKVGDESLIAKDDMVEYTLNQDKQALLLYVGGLKEVNGTFLGYDSLQNIVKMTDKVGNVYDLKVMPDSAVQAQKTPVNISEAQANSPARAVYMNGMLKSLELDVLPETISNKEINARILYADLNPVGKIIKILDERDNVQYLKLSDDVTVYINGERQGIEAIGFDQDAVLKVYDNKVLQVSIFNDVPLDDGNRTEVFTARIREISGSDISLARDDDPDKAVSYNLADGITIIKDKEAVDSSRLRQGDRVKVYTNPAQGYYVTRLEVQGQGVAIENVYRGEIREVFPGTGTLILSNVHSYGYFDWVKKLDYLKYTISDEAAIYSGNVKIDTAKLKDYIGKTVYAVSKSDFGSEELVHAVIKEGSEATSNKRIADIKWTENQATLSDGRVVKFGDGTIVIKDGRLLDTADLAKNTGAFVIQNRLQSGVTNAAIISLDSFNAFSNFHIVKGYLHNMGEDYYTVENSHRLENNTWEDNGEPTFLVSNETTIFDSAIQKDFITVDKFMESRYEPYTYTWPNYRNSSTKVDVHEDDEYHYNYDRYNKSSRYHEHYLIYTVTNGDDMARAINIYKKDKNSFNDDRVINTERMTAGQINTVDEINNSITIKNGRDYSPVYGEWRAIMANLPVNTEKAVVMKNGRVIDLSELNVNDNIYVMSEGGAALFIFID